MPDLPLPKQESTKKRILYTKDSDEIQVVQDYLFRGKEVRPAQVGEKCFDQMLKEAQQ